MKFGEVIEKLPNGCRRAIWGHDYIYSEGNFIIRYTVSRESTTLHYFTYDDLTADDWEVV